MYCLDYAEKPQLCNQLNFMLYELVFLECQFASYRYTSVRYSHTCTILQPYVVGTVRMHSDAIFFSVGAPRMKTFIKSQCSSTNNGSLQTTAGCDEPDGYM